jgi:site-specific DNA-cytosine methylase
LSMKMVDMFCGTKSMADVFATRGHQTFTIDLDPKMAPDLCADILTIEAADIIAKFGRPDVIWASPPCTTFSVASIGTHWKPDGTPRTKAAEVGLAVLNKTVAILEELNPTIWFIENPRAMMRRILTKYHRYTVTYCQYGDTRMKPTDIWSNRPDLIFAPPLAKTVTDAMRRHRGGQRLERKG